MKDVSVFEETLYRWSCPCCGEEGVSPSADTVCRKSCKEEFGVNGIDY